MNRTGGRRLGAILGACLLVLLLVLVVGVLGGWVAVVAVAGIGVAACEVALHRVVVTAFPLQRDLVLGELSARLALEQALVLVCAVRLDGLGAQGRTAVVLAVVALQVLRMVHSAAAHADDRLARPRVQARGLPGASVVRPGRSAAAGGRGREVLVAATGLLPLGLLAAAVTGDADLVVPAAVAMVLVAAAVVTASAPVARALVRGPRGGAAVAAVQQAVVRHRPDVVLYAPGRAEDVHWVSTWLDALDELAARGRPALVLVRDPEIMDRVPPSATPVVCLAEDYDVRLFALPETRVALYVANTPDNYVLLRNPDLRSAFVGHGDSDKLASTSPVSKMFDEVWVAGEAGRDRYLRADVGVRPEQIRTVGRPQVRRVLRGARPVPEAPFTVLYAPTWEGFHNEGDQLSLPHSGVEVVRRLLALDGVRVLYRPHPGTGVRDPRFARADQQVRAALAEAGEPHAVVAGPAVDLHTALNAADVLVTDITSVISEFLASGRPYVVVNGTDLDDDAFRARFPSTAGAALVGRGGAGLEAALEDARGADTMRPAREAVRVRLIGPVTDDPIALFDEAVDALGDTLRPRGARASGAVVPAGTGGGA